MPGPAEHQLGPTLGAEGFCWGVLAGSALGPFGLTLYGARRHAGLRWSLAVLTNNGVSGWLLSFGSIPARVVKAPS